MQNYGHVYSFTKYLRLSKDYVLSLLTKEETQYAQDTICLRN